MSLKTILFTCIIFCILSLKAQESDKRCIVHLSRTNNTKEVADYNAIVKQVSEENESGFLPPLKIKIELAKYDTIFLGFPTWWMQLPPPVKSFLNDYNLTGKRVIPFNTYAGYVLGSSLQTIGKLCPNSTILEYSQLREK